MVKPSLLLLVVMTVSLPLAATEVGGGISLFVPLSMIESGEGSVTFEESIETSIGLGGFFSLPLGFVYNRVDGFQVRADGLGTTEAPMFYGDCFMPYVMLKAKIPAGPLYLELFGGGAANWSFVLNPRSDQFEEYLEADGVDHVDAVDYQQVWGWGYLAGGALGVSVGQISVDIGVTWRDIRHRIDLSYEADGTPVSYREAELLLRGFSVALTGSFELYHGRSMQPASTFGINSQSC